MLESNVFAINEELPFNAPNYALELQEILKIYTINKENGIKKVYNYRDTKEKFLQIVDKFKNKYTNSDEYMDTLFEIANNLKSGSKKNKKCVTKTSKYNNENEVLFQKIYNSGLSIIDYMFYNYVEADNFLSYVSNKKYYAKNNNTYETVLNRPNKTLPIILDIIEKIKNNEIDYVEYYELTKLNPMYLRYIARDNNIECGYLNAFISNIHTQNLNLLTIETIYEDKMVINEEEISLELKKKAIDHLQSINAPLNATNYHIVIRKLVKSSK